MKTESTLHICIDYRAINANTIFDAYYFPCIDNILYHLGGSVIFNKIYLAQGYHQVCIAKGHKHSTVFQMYFRFFEYCVLFRLCNAPEIVQRLFYKIF